MNDGTKPFVCPQCGGHYFGTRLARQDNGKLKVIAYLCHDQHNVKCKWRGDWPEAKLKTEGE